ncbi:MAG: SEC-C domain-containing protein [Alicyclobacillus sp.]|nr:SEC-C domain-containing protein [Alicyclobacillus sp.]
MKTPHEMKQFPLHPEHRIRRFALDYFEEAQSDDEELLPIVLKACEIGDQTDARGELLYGAREFVVSPTMASELFRRIKDEPALQQDYARILLSAHPHVLAGLSNGLSSLPATLRRKIERRINLVSLKTPALLEEWRRFADEIRGEEYSVVDFPFVVAMAREIARRSDLPKLELSETIRKHEDDDPDDWYDDYEDAMACVLAGYLKDASAISALLDALDSDIDLLQERAMYALVRIGTQSVVDAVEERFGESEWDFHNYATGVLAGIKTSYSAAATVRLFQKATDIEERLMLADTLCRLTSPLEISAMKELRQQSDDNLDLLEVLYANCVVNGIDDPEVQQWKKSLDEIDEEFERRMRFEKAMVTRPKKKVGRNEPCPCGSGKKYKKCCGA